MPIKITVSNSLCQIENQNNSLHGELSQRLRYMDQTLEFSYHSTLRGIKRVNKLLSSGRISLSVEARKKLNKRLKRLHHVLEGIEENLWKPLYDDEGYFPTGLLSQVTQLLDKKGIKYSLDDKRIKPKTQYNFVLKESLPKLRYYQKEAARALEEAHRGVVVMPTGTGKTVTAARMIWDIGVKTLIVTPGKDITTMMVEGMTTFFGKGKVAKLDTKSKKTKAINVVNIQALINLDPKLFNDVDMVIIDEFHHSAADTYLIANEDHFGHCYYRIGLTATNFRNDGAELALRAVLSDILYEYSISQAINDGYLVPPEFRWLESMMPAKADKYQAAYKQNIVENVDRNEIITETALKHKKDSVLILVKQVNHGKELASMLPDAKFLHGHIKDSERAQIMNSFRSGKLKCLIGTSVIGEGVDLPIANVLIMAGGGKAKSQIMQNIGRVLRLYEGKDRAIIYDFKDRDDSWLEEHSALRAEIYATEYNFN